jgi:hypothetical protein
MSSPADEGLDFFAAAKSPTPAPSPPAPFGRTGAASPQGLPALPKGRSSRWAKSDTTFGPVGRLMCTIGLLLPFTFLVFAGVLTFDPFVLGGAGIWAVLMVMGLRQVWAVVKPHHRR